VRFGTGTERLSGLSPLSDREGFAVVYPDGVGGTWNDGRELDSFPAMREGIDDVGFIESLIDHLVDGFDVDPSRVYATGISNGGHMSHRLGVDLSHRLAAIAPVAASMPSLVQERAKPSSAIGVIVFFGDEDPLNWWDGGGRAGGTSASVPEIMRWWARHNGCSPEPSIEHLPGEVEDGTRIRRETWGGSPSEVVLYAIEGGGHAWPNGYQYLPESVIGRTTRNLDASQTMWAHFRRHRR
jgi:polyhydroxybutyrate depolymerase